MNRYKIKVTVGNNVMWVDILNKESMHTTKDIKKAIIFEDNSEKYNLVKDSIENEIIKVEKVEIK